MEEKQKKSLNNINKKMVIIAIIGVILVMMSILTFSVIKGKKRTNSELGNIANMGLAASNDEGVFYNKYEEGIVKVKGIEESQITNETAYSINLVGNDIYYLSVGDTNNIAIKKVKTNGSGMTTIKVVNTSISKIYVQNNYIYYVTNSNNEGIAKLNLDGTDEKVILGGEIRDFEVFDGKIYYTTKTGDLYVATDTGIDCKKLTTKGESIKEFQVKDEWVYYFNEDENVLYRIRTDGTSNQIFSQYVKSNIYNVSKDRIYFFDEETKKIASVNFSGENYREIANIATNKTRINVVGDTIYYLDAGNDESKIYQMYRIKTNGNKAKNIVY